MKEEVAKTKWCPYAVPYAQYEDEHGANRDGAGSPLKQSNCVASDCMMWIQTDNECDPEPDYKDSTAVRPEPTCYPAGRCGLAK